MVFFDFNPAVIVGPAYAKQEHMETINHAAIGFVGDGLGGEAAVAAAILACKAARVHQDLVRGCSVVVASAGVLDAGVEGEGGCLDGAGDLDSFGGRLKVDVVEVEALVGGVVLAEVGGVGKSGEGVLAGDAGEGDGAFDEAVARLSREKSEERGAGGSLSDEDAQADGAGAGLLERLDLAETDEGGELIALVDDGFGVGGPGAEGAGEDIGGELLEVGGGWVAFFLVGILTAYNSWGTPGCGGARPPSGRGARRGGAGGRRWPCGRRGRRGNTRSRS